MMGLPNNSEVLNKSSEYSPKKGTLQQMLSLASILHKKPHVMFSFVLCKELSVRKIFIY